jgi:hypothetical protein
MMDRWLEMDARPGFFLIQTWKIRQEKNITACAQNAACGTKKYFYYFSIEGLIRLLFYIFLLAIVPCC